MSILCHKIVIIGDSGVGKSSIVKNYLLNINSPIIINNNFLDRPEPTIGAAYYTVQINNIKLQVWDTAGQERYHSICPIYYRGSSGCICVFDVTNRSSFEHIIYWIDSFRSTTNNSLSLRVQAYKETDPLLVDNTNNKRKIPHNYYTPLSSTPLEDDLQVLILANKTDRPASEWQVSMEEIANQARSLNSQYLLTSSINFCNFDNLRNYLLRTYTNNEEKITPNKDRFSYCTGPCLY